MISSVTNKGKLRFMFYESNFNAQIFIDFMEKLISDCDKKVFFIVDHIKSHHAIIVDDWLKSHSDKIELFFLPTYCPEYNPDEYLNGNLKREMSKLECSKTKEMLKSNVNEIMEKFKNNGSHVASLFLNSYVKYAA